MKIFHNDWERGSYKESLEAMLNDFSINRSYIDGCKIIFAAYTYEDYIGEAFVLFKENGVLYEVNGSHCSCYGLENQWNPEETNFEVLKMRFQPGYLFKGFKNELMKVIKEMEMDEVYENS